MNLDGEVCKGCGAPAVGWEPRFNYFYCAAHEHTSPVAISRMALARAELAEKEFDIPPLVPDSRLLDIIRGYVADNSDNTTRPDMNGERHLLTLARVIADECKARIPLFTEECKAVLARARR